MANKTGAKWNKGGSKSRKRMLDIDFSCFEDYAEKLDKLGASLEKTFSTAMENASKQVQEDTLEALETSHLPEKGKYQGKNKDTEASVIRDTKQKINGSVISVDLGFDKTKPGAGGFLITGTPKMQPDYALADIYGRKSYASKIKKQIEKDLQKEIDSVMGGKN